MAKQWIKEQVKRNELQDIVEQGIKWTAENRQTAAMSAGGFLLAAAFALSLVYRHYATQTSAWDRLALAQNYAYGGKIDDSLRQLGDLSSELANTKAASFGQVFVGDIRYRQGLYKEAVDAYAKILERDEPKVLVPVALADTGVAQEAAGLYSQAAATYQRFLDGYPDHFMAPQVHTGLARCFMAMGQMDPARTTLQKITLQYPDTPWAAMAQARLSGK